MYAYEENLESNKNYKFILLYRIFENFIIDRGTCKFYVKLQSSNYHNSNSVNSSGYNIARAPRLIFAREREIICFLRFSKYFTETYYIDKTSVEKIY